MSAHFSLPELLHSDTARQYNIDNYPSWEEVDNLRRLADTMERVRRQLGDKPVTISSAFRCAAVNAKVGGATNSAHLYGLACDFTVPSFGTPEAICKALEPHLVEFDIDQLIWEFGSWVHLGLSSTAARHMALTIDNSGTRSGFA